MPPVAHRRKDRLVSLRVASGHVQDLIVARHDRVKDLLGLLEALVLRFAVATDHRQPLARHDELGTDRDRGKKPVELRPLHAIGRGALGREEPVDLIER